MARGHVKGWFKFNGRRNELLYLLAAFIENDEWVYVSNESLAEALRLLTKEDESILIEEDELGSEEVIVRLREEDD